VERVQWHQVVVKDERLSKLATDFLKKGSQVYVEGAMEYRDYTDRETGAKRPVAEIVVGPFRGDIQLLDRKPQGPG
jgi:single-strand DNA-binding protein